MGLICEPSDVLPSLCAKKTIRALNLFSALIIRVLDQICVLTLKFILGIVFLRQVIDRNIILGILNIVVQEGDEHEK